MNNKVELIAEQRRCPQCGSVSIRFGIQTWSPKGVPDKIQRWQRMKCKNNNHLWYCYLETVSVSNRGCTSKPELPISASLAKLIGVGGSDKRKEASENELERNNT